MSLGSAFGGLFGGGDDAPKFDAAGAIKAQEGQNTGALITNAQAAGRNGPFGSSNYSFDPITGKPTGVNTSLDPSLNAGGFAGNLGALGGQLPTGINYDSTTPGNILNAGMSTYDALAADPMRQGQNRISQEMANRGIPLNDQIATDMQGNFDRQNALARQSAFSTLYGQLPGMQATMTDTANKQGMTPFQMANANLGLVSGLNSLAPQAGQVQTGPVDAMGAMTTAYNGDLNAWKTQKQSDAALLNTIGMGAGLIAGGPMGASLMSGAKGLFNGGGSFDASGNR